MTAATTAYGPGSIIRARGREWLVLPGSEGDVLHVRPLSGSEQDQTRIHVALEREPVGSASFPRPEIGQQAGHDAALLLRDALLLSLRRGAGPFRSFGQIAVEPRAYQLVPLMVALKLNVVRLLIADDVGVGKSVEAGLIAREMLDREEIDGFTVLCPPHLVDQWVKELRVHFHLRAVAVTAGNADRIQRDLPPTASIFREHPITVVSLDYIKSDTRRQLFLPMCPRFVIVDEAHTCAGTARGQHRRYELLRDLAAQPERHIVLLTATPHSGDDAAFYRLLGLLDRDFENLAHLTGEQHARLRERLGQHFVQRRRPDIAEWQQGGESFPKRDPRPLTYKLTGPWENFLDAVLTYCGGVVEPMTGNERRLSFWETLALMRCAASSPAAAVRALRGRAGLEDVEDEDLEDRVFDGTADSLPEDDVEPTIDIEDPELRGLVAQAQRLAGQAGDPKLKALTEHVRELLDKGFNPVVFCRFVATAEYVGKHLRGKFTGVEVEVVTGDLPPESRAEKVELLGERADRHVLVATDCLSEGINLQEHFDAVVHYDLSWNPTRHEQREGRVDRFGQKSPIVRATLMYGENNPVDGAVLQVILNKAKRIRETLGVAVPLPDDGHALTKALLRAVILRHREQSRQQVLDFESTPEGRAIDERWQDATEKAKRNMTIFAQRRIKPEDVLEEWKKALTAIGGRDDVERFTDRALARMGSGIERLRKGGFKAPLARLPEDVLERLENEGMSGTLLIDFAYPPAGRCHPVQRSHPLVSILAETLLERSLARGGGDGAGDPAVLGRVGCWISPAGPVKTIIALLRLRHQLTVQSFQRASTLIVEEASAVAWTGASGALATGGTDALMLLSEPPAGDPPQPVRLREMEAALKLVAESAGDLDEFAERRAQALLADHRRVREAAGARGSYAVKALLSPDVIGVFVLLPKV